MMTEAGGTMVLTGPGSSAKVRARHAVPFPFRAVAGCSDGFTEPAGNPPDGGLTALRCPK